MSSPQSPVLRSHAFATSYPHLDSGVYNYPVPRGFGDTFYMYAYDAVAAGLVNGQSYSSLSFPIIQGQGDFVHRYTQGVDSVTPSIQIYDWQKRRYFSDMANLGFFRQGMVVLPEKTFPYLSTFQFDLGPVAMTQVGSDDVGNPVFASQLVFSGARRLANGLSDPAPSLYKWYAKTYRYVSVISIPNFAQIGGVAQPPTSYKLDITDFDFELWRIEVGTTPAGQWTTTNGAGTFNLSPFKIQLYDTNREILTNIPILADYICHRPRTVANPNVPLAFFPSPPMMYRVNSSIRFDIYSLLTQSGANTPLSLPANFAVDFVGIQRIPC